MKSIIPVAIAFAVMAFSITTAAHSQTASPATKMDITKFQAVSVSLSPVKIGDEKTIQVIKDAAVKEFDEPTFAKLTGTNFKNGTIEVKVLSKLLKDAPDFARGFIGVAFRINENNSKFECLYLRPTNGRAEDQLRRNRSTQYFAYPDFKFERLRKEAPGHYESYVDIGTDEWIDIKIAVKDTQAKLFVNGNKQPTLIVNDLKHGPNSSGSIGLWVDIGTEGHFANLKIENH